MRWCVPTQPPYHRTTVPPYHLTALPPYHPTTLIFYYPHTLLPNYPTTSPPYHPATLHPGADDAVSTSAGCQRAGCLFRPSRGRSTAPGHDASRHAPHIIFLGLDSPSFPVASRTAHPSIHSGRHALPYHTYQRGGLWPTAHGLLLPSAVSSSLCIMRTPRDSSKSCTGRRADWR